jgi:uncharacterized membrane protein (TIGR02234 family)
MSPRSSPALAVIGCALAGGLVLLASGREWAQATLPPGSGGSGSLSVTGHQVTASIPAIAYALLALAVAILASSGFMRRVVGGVVTLVGVLAIAVALHARGDVSQALSDQEHGATGIAVHASANGWWVVVVIGGLLAIAAGSLTVVKAGAWSRMSEKYDAPTSTSAPTADPGASTWDALDRGEDPTE